MLMATRTVKPKKQPKQPSKHHYGRSAQQWTVSVKIQLVTGCDSRPVPCPSTTGRVLQGHSGNSRRCRQDYVRFGDGQFRFSGHWCCSTPVTYIPGGIWTSVKSTQFYCVNTETNHATGKNQTAQHTRRCSINDTQTEDLA